MFREYLIVSSVYSLRNWILLFKFKLCRISGDFVLSVMQGWFLSLVASWLLEDLGTNIFDTAGLLVAYRNSRHNWFDFSVTLELTFVLFTLKMTVSYVSPMTIKEIDHPCTLCAESVLRDKKIKNKKKSILLQLIYISRN